jgi:hypothetical protein
VHGDPRLEKICEVSKLGAYEVLQISSPPLVPDQQILVGRERSDAIAKDGEAVGRSLADNCLHEAEDIHDPMIGLSHQKVRR